MFKKIILIVLLIFIFNLTIYAKSLPYKISNTKEVLITNKIDIKKTNSNKILNLDLFGTLFNNENRAYFQTQLPDKDVIEKENSNYYYKLYLDELKDNYIYNINYKAKVSMIKYNLNFDSISKISSYNNQEKKFLKPSDMIQSDNSLIINKAKEINNNETNPLIIAKNIFEFVYLYMNYDIENGNNSALHALNTAHGVCEDYAQLMVALLRASNIPAKTVSGYKIPVDIQTLDISKTNQYNHMWVEFYIKEYGWIPADPTISFVGEKYKIDYNFGELKEYYLPLAVDSSIYRHYQYDIVKNENVDINLTSNTYYTILQSYQNEIDKEEITENNRNIEKNKELKVLIYKQNQEKLISKYILNGIGVKII